MNLLFTMTNNTSKPAAYKQPALKPDFSSGRKNNDLNPQGDHWNTTQSAQPIKAKLRHALRHRWSRVAHSAGRHEHAPTNRLP
jgi:hypothetical protein